VRDIALAHQLALEKPAAGGERIIVCASAYKFQDFGASSSAPLHARALTQTQSTRQTT
jgi:nucleoside-diphosphate-sugar epimerase